MGGKYLLEMLDISKELPGMKAIKQGDFKVGYGEVHGLTSPWRLRSWELRLFIRN